MAILSKMLVLVLIMLIGFCAALLLVWLGLWIVVGGIMLTVRFARSMYATNEKMSAA